MVRRFDPLRDLLTLQDRMNRLFEESLAQGRLEPAAAAWEPLADVLDRGDSFHVEVELPGVDLEDVHLRAERRRLVISGERRLDSEARPEGFQRMERRYGPFRRAFDFTDDVDAGRVAADMKDGVLRIDLPKARARVLRVRVERRE